jgi:hypothetical protein
VSDFIMTTIIDRTVTVHRHGQFVDVIPAPEGLLGLLQTLAHRPELDAACGVRVVPRLEPMFGGWRKAAEIRVSCWAGLEPVVCRALRDAGHRVRRTGTGPPPLAPPAADAFYGWGARDEALLDYVQRVDRGIIRIRREDVDVARLVAQVAQAWPEARLAVAAARVADVLALHRQLRLRGVAAVPLTGRHRPPGPHRVMVTTYTYSGLGWAEVEHLDFVVALDAAEMTSQVGRDCLALAHRARLFGVLDHDALLAPRDADLVRELFGFHQLIIPQHGHRERPVIVARHRIVGGRRLPDGLALLDLKRQGLWHHAMRNRRLARLAQLLRTQDHRQLYKRYRPVAAALAGRPVTGVLVLVENVEHALALANLLPGWRLATAAVWAGGLTVHQEAQLQPDATSVPTPIAHLIATTAALDRASLGAVDVVLRADGGSGLPPLPRRLLESQEASPRPLLVIDCQNQHHRLLERWSRDRQQAYRQRGWYSAGTNPVDAEVERFLATRTTRRT